MLFGTLNNIQRRNQIVFALYFALMQSKYRGGSCSTWLEYGDRFSILCNQNLFPGLVYFINYM